MDHFEAIEKAKRTDYAHDVVGGEINWGDAGAFFLEGAMYAAQQCAEIAESRMLRRSLAGGLLNSRPKTAEEIAAAIRDAFCLPKAG